MRPSRQVYLVCLVALVCAVASACVSVDPISGAQGADGSTTTIETEVVRTTIIPTMRPTSAESLGIVSDRSGRPYDNYWGPQGSTTETRLLTRLQIDRGELELIGGEALMGQVPITVRDTVSVRFRDATELDLRIVWEQRPAGGDDADSDDSATGEDSSDAGEDGSEGDSDAGAAQIAESILGVSLNVRGTTVVRWGPFLSAYETDDGIGGIVARSVLTWADRNLEFGTPLIDAEFIEGRPFILDDLDEEDGRDIFLFDNGTDGEPGEYSYTKGFDEDDVLVAIMIWDPRYPWRLAVPTGTPPPDVTEREDELIDCIEGRRLIDKWGRCT